MSISLVPTKEEFDIIQTIAKTAAESQYFSKLGGMAGIFTIALYAREIGVSPMVAIFGGFSNIQGKITMSAELMNSLIRRAGHKIQIEVCDNQICTIKGERADNKDIATVSFTFAEAKAAGLVKQGGAWEKYTSDMLFARCLSRLRRRLFPDVATRAYVEGEIEEEGSKNAIDITPPVNLTDPLNQGGTEECITQEEAFNLETLIGDDLEYRKAFLKWLKVDSMLLISKKNYPTALANVTKRYELRMAKKQETEEETNG